jgi:U3 small nucleolar RNA-associated protein 20
MGHDKFEHHLKQVVANINYEFQEGRMSAIIMMSSLIEKLPDELLEKHAQLIFLPLVLQMVNDDSKECREGVAKCLELLLSRSSTEVLKSFHDYTVRWSKSAGPLQVASLQVFGIFVESCADFIRGNDFATSWIQTLQELLQDTTVTQSEWEVPYFALISVEKLAQDFDLELSQQTELWTSIVERLADPHPWIKLASGRILHKFFVSSDMATTVLNKTPGMLFDITKNLCFQLNVNEEEQTEDLSDLTIKTLTMILPIMQEKPHLCFAADSIHKNAGRDPVAWLMRRLSAIAKPKGRKHRMAVFKCFAAFITRHNAIVESHMELMLEPLHRSDIEASNELEAPSVLHKRDPGSEAVVTESTFARDILQLLEESCSSPEEFLKAYAVVKSRFRDRKTQRKSEVKAEAVSDPRASALRKMGKQKHEKERLKRRIDDRRRDRGATKKRRSF